MAGKFTIDETMNALAAIFEKHKDERVCVIGTICAGKTTLMRRLAQYHCLDIDDELWPNLPEEEKAFLNQTPWTKEMGEEIDRLMYQYMKIKPGYPLFTTVILDCEAVVYLDIENGLLEEHCKKRRVGFTDALNIKAEIEEDWNRHEAKKEKMFYYLRVTE